MTRRRILDLFGGVGGAGVGYDRAGWDVYAVDVLDHPDNPHPIHVGDAILALARLLAGERLEFRHRDGRVEELGLQDFHAIHASPPCQAYSGPNRGTNAVRDGDRKRHPKLIGPVRYLLERTGLPWVIENVQGAPLRRDLTLCGEMFGLAVLRHRYFEFSPDVVPPQVVHPRHRGRVRGWRHGEFHDGPYVAVYGDGGGKADLREAQEAMGIDWTDDPVAIREAIPPAYAELIGRHLLELVEERAA